MLIVLSSFSLCLISETEEPIEITWDDLSDVEYEEVYSKSIDAHYTKPIFGNRASSLHGQLISLTGFYTKLGTTYNLLTMNTLNNLHCGNRLNNELHEIIQLKGFEVKNLNLGNEITLTGRLILNNSDPTQMN
ncbi:MAG: hypothetical protein AB8B53_12855 [Flavobacteriales bacterium]